MNIKGWILDLIKGLEVGVYRVLAPLRERVPKHCCKHLQPMRIITESELAAKGGESKSGATLQKLAMKERSIPPTIFSLFIIVCEEMAIITWGACAPS